jgi:hypothetical protein
VPVPTPTITATGRATPTASAPPARRDPPSGTGVLTVICFPACDHVYDNSRDLGMSPVFQKEVPAGEHRLKLTTSNPPATKILTVIIAADEMKTIKQPMQ